MNAAPPPPEHTALERKQLEKQKMAPTIIGIKLLKAVTANLRSEVCVCVRACTQEREQEKERERERGEAGAGGSSRRRLPRRDKEEDAALVLGETVMRSVRGNVIASKGHF